MNNTYPSCYPSSHLYHYHCPQQQQQQQQQQPQQEHRDHSSYYPGGMWTSSPPLSAMLMTACTDSYAPPPVIERPKLTTTIWEDQNTICYQMEVRNICVTRRGDNDMINGTKLLNVVGMSRGKRDGILKNEKGRVVVRVGAMYLKGVWIPYAQAKILAVRYKVLELLGPLFAEEPQNYVLTTMGLSNASISSASSTPKSSEMSLALPPPPPVAATTAAGLPLHLPSDSHQAQQQTYDYSNLSHWDYHSYGLGTTTTSQCPLMSPPLINIDMSDKRPWPYTQQTDDFNDHLFGHPRYFG
ncbi:transcription regulator HTH, apses-type DNA-binding domain-containing protein [Dichotomocladium elegans]|nr:transcription regulator HTH, apses-type DNA-binding domain-containing protein [Dichotomocladium elegans]